MKTRIDELVCSRCATHNEEKFLLNYFVKKNASEKKVAVIFFTILYIFCMLLVSGRILGIIERCTVVISDIVSFFVSICIFIISMYCLNKQKNGGKYVKMIKLKQYRVSDVTCKKARFFVDTSDRKDKYECTLQLSNGTMLKHKYYIGIKDIKDYDASKKNIIMNNRPMLICSFPYKKYTKLFDKLNVSYQ